MTNIQGILSHLFTNFRKGCSYAFYVPWIYFYEMKKAVWKRW